jgi:hypothetical protein
MTLGFVILMSIGYIAGKKFVLTNEISTKVREFLQLKNEGQFESLTEDQIASFENLKEIIF